MGAAIADEANGASKTTVVQPKQLLSKRELAGVLSVSERSIEHWTAAKRIPFLRISRRMNRYSLPRVLAALNRYEVLEVGARK